MIKRFIFVIALGAIAALAIVLLRADSVEPGSIDAAADATAESDLGAELVLLPHPAVPDDAELAIVSRLADGDSFDITWSADGRRDEIRLLGINAPEASACFGTDAREVLEILVDGETLSVEGVERDEFGRLIAYVWIGDLFVNATLVELGAALALADGGAHSSLINQAQGRAERELAGLWSPDACGGSAYAAVGINNIEFDAPGADNQNPNGEWIDIINAEAVDVDLSGWSIRDQSTRNRFEFPAGFTIAGGSIVRVHSGCGDDAAAELFWCARDPVWNNGGDAGFLIDPDGNFADTMAYDG